MIREENRGGKELTPEMVGCSSVVAASVLVRFFEVPYFLEMATWFKGRGRSQSRVKTHMQVKTATKPPKD